MQLLKLHRNVKVRLIEAFINSALYTMLLPFMVIYFAQKFGEIYAGLILLGNITAGIVSSTFGGYLADRFGRRKILLISSLVRSCAFAIMALSNSPWLEMPLLTLLATTVNSIVFGFASPADEAMIIDATDESNRKYVYGISYWMMNLSMFIGSLAGGFFFQNYLFQLILGVLCGSLLDYLLIVFFIEELYKPNVSEKFNFKIVSGYRKVLLDKTFILFIFAFMLFVSVEFQVRNYLAVRLAKEISPQTFMTFNIDGVSLFGLVVSENTFLVFLFGLIIPKLVSQYSNKIVLCLGVFIYTLSYALTSVFNNPFGLILAMAFATLGELMCVPIIQSVVADLCPDDNRSSYLAIKSIFMRMATVLGSLAVTIGAFLPSWAMGIMFFLIGLLSLFIFNTSFRGQLALKEV